jgi:hypothetical protein
MDTKFWRRYEKGKDYLDTKNLMTRTNTNWNFFVGKQWEGIEADGEELPMFNFIHPNVMRKVTTIYTNRMAVNYTDLDGRAALQPVYEKLSQMFSAKWEKANEDVLCRKALKHGCVTGDGLQYFPTGDVEDVQILYNTDILYGDESEPNIQRQPYIIIQERRSVEEVKEMARQNGIPEDEVALIVPDRDTDYTLGNIDEVQNSDSTDSMKVTMITHFEKKKEPITEMVWEDSDGIREGTMIQTGERDVVYIAKCTKTAMVENERPIKGSPSPIDQANGKQGRALSLYPIIKFSWEEYPNDARGISQVEGLIPNQLLINKTLARRSMTTQNTAYPRVAYSSQYVQNPDDLMKVGMPIEINGGDAMSVNQAVSYLNPAQSNDEPKRLTDDLLEITQELSGSGDTTMGNIDLQRVAASAIVAVNDQAQSMHDDTVANLQLFVEDMANLWVELWQVFNPNGMTVVVKQEVQEPVIDPMTGEPAIDPMTGQPQTQSKEIEVPQQITAEELDQIKPRTRIDVTKDNSFTREAQQQVIDGLLDKGLIDLEEWTELATDTSPVPKHGLEIILQRRKAEMLQTPMQPQMPPQGAPQGAPPEQ